MKPIAPRKAKIECNRVKRKTFVLSKDIKIIFLQYILIFLTVKSKYMHSEKKKF